MNPFLILLVLFVAVPIAEIYVLMQVGSVIGVLSTIGIVVLTAIIGAGLVRAQGLATLRRIQAGLGEGEAPGIVLIEGALILFAGALLLTPGFITDAVGFLLLFPPSRAWLAARAARSAAVHVRSGLRRPGPFGGPAGGGVIDGEFSREKRPTDAKPIDRQ